MMYPIKCVVICWCLLFLKWWFTVILYTGFWLSKPYFKRNIIYMHWIKVAGGSNAGFQKWTKQISQSNSSVLFYWGNHGKPVVLASSEETLHGCLCRPIWQEGCPFATLMVAGTQSRQPIFCHVRSVDLTRVWYRTATTWRYLSFLELLNPYVPDCWQPLSLKPNWWGLFITSLW